MYVRDQWCDVTSRDVNEPAITHRHHYSVVEPSVYQVRDVIIIIIRPYCHHYSRLQPGLSRASVSPEHMSTSHSLDFSPKQSSHQIRGRLGVLFCSLVVLGTGTGTWSALKYNCRVLVLVLVLACQVLVLVLVLVRKYLLPRQIHLLL